MKTLFTLVKKISLYTLKLLIKISFFILLETNDILALGDAFKNSIQSIIESFKENKGQLLQNVNIKDKTYYKTTLIIILSGKILISLVIILGRAALQDVYLDVIHVSLPAILNNIGISSLDLEKYKLNLEALVPNKLLDFITNMIKEDGLVALFSKLDSDKDSFLFGLAVDLLFAKLKEDILKFQTNYGLYVIKPYSQYLSYQEFVKSL